MGGDGHVVAEVGDFDRDAGEHDAVGLVVETLQDLLAGLRRG